MISRMLQSTLFGLYFTSVSSPVGVVLIFLWIYLRRFEATVYILGPPSVLFAIWLFVVVPYLAQTAAWARNFMGSDFWESADFAWGRLRQIGATFPLIGRVFERNEGPSDPPPST